MKIQTKNTEISVVIEDLSAKSGIKDNDRSDQIEDILYIITEVEKLFKKSFPKGWFDKPKPEHIVDRLPYHISTTFDFGIVGKDELYNGIDGNDPVYHRFYLSHSGYNLIKLSKFEGGIATIPPKGSHLAIKSINTGLAKSSGSKEKLVKDLGKFLRNLKVLVKKHQANIFMREDYSDKYFK